MSRSAKAAIVLACLLLLAVAFILGGGVYRTVNVGRGSVYIVNRFTGSTSVVRGGVILSLAAEKQAQADESKRAKEEEERAGELSALEMVKHRRAFLDFNTRGDEYITVEASMREIQGEVKGPERFTWKAWRQPNGLILVGFVAKRPNKGLANGLWWEVDLDNKVVRCLLNDPELTKHYSPAIARYRSELAKEMK